MQINFPIDVTLAHFLYSVVYTRTWITLILDFKYNAAQINLDSLWVYAFNILRMRNDADFDQKLTVLLK